MLPYIDYLPFLTGWQYRWFVLDENAGLFSYYTSKEKMVKGVRRGCVRLQGAVIGIDDEVSLSVQCGQWRHHSWLSLVPGREVTLKGKAQYS